MKSKIQFLATALLAGLLIGLLGCSSENPISPNDDDAVNKTVKNASATSVDIFKNVSSFKQISDLIHGPEALVDIEIPEMQNPQKAMSFAKGIRQQAFAKVKSDQRLLKSTSTLADSVIWDITYRDDIAGVTYRSSLIYNNETGRGRLFFVAFDFRETHPLAYDSTEIIADLNFTLLDDSDDVLISIENLKRFKPGRLIDEQLGRFTPDPYLPGTEPTGGILTADITYSSSSFIRSTHAQLEYHEGSGGRFEKLVQFADNSSASVAVTFAEDGTGSFSETRRDGTKIEGTFDSAEKDGHGSFSKTITFRAGHDPVSISESGEFTIRPDSTVNGSFERIIRFRDGSTREESVTVDQTRVGDVLTTSLNVENADGSHGFINIVETPEVDQVSGEWTNADQTFVVFTAESYPDGSAHLKFDVYASEAAFENGAAPIASGEFDFYPDGSGRGTVTEGGKTYEVTINPDGSVIIKPL
jgi:hypothetical protein